MGVMHVPTQQDRPAPVTWSQVDDGFHVASRDGNFLGYVDLDDEGVYHAFDMTSTQIGRFTDLREAVRAVDSRDGGSNA